MTKKRINVRFLFDPSAETWTARVLDEPGVITEGKTLVEAHRRIRDALSLVRSDFDELLFSSETTWDHYTDLPAELARVLKLNTDLRLKSLDIKDELERTTESAAKMLQVKKFTVRKAGQLMGVTFQRVQQLYSNI